MHMYIDHALCLGSAYYFLFSLKTDSGLNLKVKKVMVLCDSTNFNDNLDFKLLVEGISVHTSIF